MITLTGLVRINSGAPGEGTALSSSAELKHLFTQSLGPHPHDVIRATPFV